VDATNQNCGAPLYTHTPLVGTPSDDFYAVLYGDISGNWTPAAAPLAPPTGPEGIAARADRERATSWYGIKRSTVPPPRSVAAATLSLEGWDAVLAPGVRRTVRLRLADSDGIEGLDLALRFDPSRLRIVAVEADDIGAALAVASRVDGGTLRISAYGVAPLAGSGTFLKVTVEATGRLGARAPFEVSAQANEGAIPVVTKDTGATKDGRGNEDGARPRGRAARP
jgi:hypothetical protein